MHSTKSGENAEIYDAELSQIDETSGLILFRAGDNTHQVECRHPSYWSVGTVGRLRVPSAHHTFAFRPYPDQRLRRDPQEDDERLNLWGWRIGQLSFACKAGVIPGRDGLVIVEDTEPVTLQLPREFIELCRSIQVRPETVLVGFISDLCQLRNWIHCPREDGYSSNGSDERRLAGEYFQRAYAWLSHIRNTG